MRRLVHRLTRSSHRALFALLCGCLTCSIAAAQSSGRTLGSSITPGNRTAFGSGSGAGSATGLGNSAGTGLDALGSAGQISGSERFVRGTRDASQFVGADIQDSQFVGALESSGSGLRGSLGGRQSGLGRMGNLGSMRGGMQGRLGGQNANGRNGPGGRDTGPGGSGSVNIRTQLRVGFRYRSIEPQRVQTNLARRLSVGTLAQSAPLQIDLTGRTATLRGVVASETDRELAIRLASLEPGVSAVVDELTVASAEEIEAASPSDLP